MFSRFFIERPIFANVIALVTVLLGVVTLMVLPVEQFPQITPPTVQVSAAYPGIDAIQLAECVADPIEKEVNGVEGAIYMSSTSTSDGSYKLTVTFKVGTNLDMAQVLVQNKVAIALPKLPEEVKVLGVSTKKQSTAIVLVVTLTAADGAKESSLTLANYAYQLLRDELSRVEGVGDVNVFGSNEYSMRIWMDPAKLKARNLTVEDVQRAIKEQNKQVAAGKLGGAPSPSLLEYTLTTRGRLADVEQFRRIIIRKGEGKRLIYLEDIAEVEMGDQTYSMYCERTGEPAAGIAIYQLPGANALKLATDIRKKLKELEPALTRENIVYDIPFDTTKFVDASVHEVYKTLFEAGILVLIVILLFLQDWRAVLVPATTIPVTIIGAFIFMAAFGFSINMLTLFGLVLAIGIVVDDAIVIVENAAHHIEHDKMTPKDATIKAMSEILGPIIGITLVLMAVFVPTAFLGGITGQLYRQFALTIAATAVISAINAMTLKPAQCAVYLRPTPPVKNAFFRGFDRYFAVCERFYTAGVRWFVRLRWPAMAVYAGLIALTVWWFTRLPTGFLPVEDQGYVVIGVQLPDARSLNVTKEVTTKLNAILKETKGVRNWVTMGGNSLLDAATASNAATLYVIFDDWHERTTPDLSQDAIVADLRRKVSTIQQAIVFVVIPPSIQGLGIANGFQMQLQYKGKAPLRDQLEQLQEYTQIIQEDGNQTTGLTNLNSSFRANVPQLYLDINDVQLKSYDVTLDTVFSALQGFLGSQYVNDFTQNGRTYQVRIQAEAFARRSVTDIQRIEVPTKDKTKKVPLGAILNVKKTYGPVFVNRYQLYATAAITGEAAQGYSSGQALNRMEGLANETLPGQLGYAWTGVSYQEKQVGSESYLIFGLAVLLVFMVLAAQYESWSAPAAVILVVPLGLLGAAAAVGIRGMDVNIYTQIGLVLIIALASKNAILIIEFARELRAHGKSIDEAAIEAARLRFRPILMTSFAFILGIVPLLTAHSAGAASQRALGTAVFGGMIASTFLAVYFVPVFYVIMQSFSEWWSPPKLPVAAPVEPRT